MGGREGVGTGGGGSSERRLTLQGCLFSLQGGGERGMLLMNMGTKEATPEPPAPPFYRGCFVRYTEPPHVREWRQAAPGE